MCPLNHSVRTHWTRFGWLFSPRPSSCLLPTREAHPTEPRAARADAAVLHSAGNRPSAGVGVRGGLRYGPLCRKRGGSSPRSTRSTGSEEPACHQEARRAAAWWRRVFCDGP